MENKEIETNNQDENTIIELATNNEDTLYDDGFTEQIFIKKEELEVAKKEAKRKLSNKGKKIIAGCIIGVIILITIILLLVYFLVIKKNDKKPNKPSSGEEVVVQKENYVYENGYLKFLDDDKIELGSYECTIKEKDKCYIAYLDNEDEFDNPVYMTSKSERLKRLSKIYDDKYVFIFDDNVVNLYDIDKKEVLKKYSLIKANNVNDSTVVVVKDKNNKYGIVSLDGGYKEKVDLLYDYIGIADNNELFVVKDKTGSYLINLNGKVVSGKIGAGNIKLFTEDYISVKNDNKYYLYDLRGQKVLEESFDYIDFYDEFVITISDSKMFIYDSSLNKLNEKYIKVKNDNYQKQLIFDDKNNLSDTKKSYTITKNGNTLNIEVVESKSKVSNKEIDLQEVSVNIKYKYVSYIDGSLYFYKDEKKTDLLGSYSCNNKNDSSSEEYTNCFIAKTSNIVDGDEGKYISIINNNYVFIYDAKSANDATTINLYDISSNTVKARYKKVDTNVSSENISYIDLNGGMIFAQNADGYLGAITFTSSGPNGLIPFKENNIGTTSISYFDDYLLVARGDKEYLYNVNGEKVASSNFHIIEYLKKYLVVENQGYLVYHMVSSESGDIISNEEDYFKLYSSFFIGIKDKKLNVYSYDNGKVSLLNDAIDIKLNDLAKSYEVKEYSDAYVISVIQSDGSKVDYKYHIDWSAFVNEGE